MSTDPFDALREPPRPVRPDPAFAARLRDRLERLLLDPTAPIDPREYEMTGLIDTTGTTDRVRLRQGDLSYTALWTPDLSTADRFYTTVLGWETVGDHGGSGRQVTNLRSGFGMFGGQEPTLFFAAVVDDADAGAERVRAAGGSVGDRHEMPYGTLVDCHDDQGLAFSLHQPPPGDAPTVGAGPGGPGELAYIAVRVPDAGRARAFYGSVLGWTFQPGTEAGHWHVGVGDGQARPAMIGVGEHPDEPPHIAPMYTVADVDAACAAVRAAGGTAAAPESLGYGVSAECRDDQGSRFWVARF